MERNLHHIYHYHPIPASENANESKNGYRLRHFRIKVNVFEFDYVEK